MGRLAAKGLLVARETYSHHYPVCWRCSTQLLFRLVDEWFIAMDPLREEISGVTRQVQWSPLILGSKSVSSTGSGTCATG